MLAQGPHQNLESQEISSPFSSCHEACCAEENGNSFNPSIKGSKLLYAKRGNQPQIKSISRRKQHRKGLEKNRLWHIRPNCFFAFSEADRFLFFANAELGPAHFLTHAAKKKCGTVKAWCGWCGSARGEKKRELRQKRAPANISPSSLRPRANIS